METVIQELSRDNLADVNQVDGTFTIDSRLVLSYDCGEINYTIESVPPHTKHYPLDPIDYSQYISNPDRTVFLAYLDGKMAGQVVISRHWNKFAIIDWIVVDAGCRGRGIGTALMQRAIQWAKEKSYPGIMLETQDNNAAACQFYAACGFKPGGFDHYLYYSFADVAHEIAIYWYLIF